MPRLGQILSFFELLDRLKSVERKVYCANGRPESSAEHSWHLAMLVLLLCEEFKDADLLRMLKLALVHDIVEIEAGDTFAFDAEAAKSQPEREALAARSIFAQLPPDMEQDFLGLFDEFEAQETRESQIVKSLDKLQAVVQNVCSEGKGWKLHQLTFEQVDAHKRPHMTHDPTLLRLYDLVMEQAKEKKLL